MAGGKIFINYRREDTGGYARSLFDRLNVRFPNQVFMDVSGSIEFGLDFAEEIQKAVSACDALIVLIGRQWLGVKDAAGRRRLDDPKDFVGLEISTALQRNVRVIPALVGGATMPTEEDLPLELKPLTRRQALLLSDQDWDHTVERLTSTLQGVLVAAPAAVSKKPEKPKKLPVTWIGGGVAAAVLISFAAFVLAHRRQPSSGPTPSPAPATNSPSSTAAPVTPTTNPPASPLQSATSPVLENAQKPGSPVSQGQRATSWEGAHSKGKNPTPILQALQARHVPTSNAAPAPQAKSFDALVLDGDLAYQDGQYDKALAAYLKAHHLNSTNRGVRRKIATTLMLLGRPEEARQYQ